MRGRSAAAYSRSGTMRLQGQWTFGGLDCVHRIHGERRLVPSVAATRRNRHRRRTSEDQDELLASGDRVRWRALGVGCRRACGRPRRASGGVASECRRTNVEARGGHRPHATTREDHQSGAGDPSQGMGCSAPTVHYVEATSPVLAERGRLAGAGTGCGDGAEPIWRTSRDDSFRAGRLLPIA